MAGLVFIANDLQTRANPRRCKVVSLGAVQDHQQIVTEKIIKGHIELVGILRRYATCHSSVSVSVLRTYVEGIFLAHNGSSRSARCARHDAHSAAITFRIA